MGIQYNPRAVTDGLVLCLDAANPKSYPGSGTIWSDLSGRGNTGTLTNGPTYSTANGGFFTFNGTNQEVTTTTQFSAPQTFSIGAWFKTSTASGKKIIGFEGNQTGTGSNTYDRMVYMGSDGKLYFAINSLVGGQTYAISSLTYNDNNWHYVMGTYGAEGTTMRLYVDGVSVATNTATNENSSGYWRIGGYRFQSFWTNGSDGYFSGSISNVVVYNRGLIAAEIQQNFNALAGRFFDARIGFSASNPLSSPVQAQSLGYAAGSYYFKSGAMSVAQQLEYQPNYYESRPFCCVFRSPYGSTATTNKIDLSIPMAGLLVQRDTLDLRGAVYWSVPITYTTVGGTGNNTADSGTGYAGSNARRVILGNAGGHGLYNTGQSSCNWPSAAGAIGAGYNLNCGTFPNGLIWGTGSGGSPVYDNQSGIWSHWITWS